MLHVLVVVEIIIEGLGTLVQGRVFCLWSKCMQLELELKTFRNLMSNSKLQGHSSRGDAAHRVGAQTWQGTATSSRLRAPRRRRLRRTLCSTGA